MITHDDAQNVAMAASPAQVDAINERFYGAIRYPGPPSYFERVADPRFWAGMLDHDLCRWDAPVLPGGRGRVWVAGCGTNQAVITALMFPEAEVVGSDLSPASLEMAERNARGLGVSNLTLRAESLFGAAYDREFDYVVCTGVVHHTADPPAAMARLAGALRPGGVMQLMVYNRYHRAMTTAFQKVVRAMSGDGEYAYERELALARRFVDHYAGPGEVAGWLATHREHPDAYLADALIQPVEHSYTVQSLAHLSAAAGLHLLAPCPNAHDAAAGSLHWELEMGDPELQRAYDALPDLQRWQVTNLLLQEQAPMLWFYLQRADSPHPRLTTRERCAAFLQRRFAPTRTVRRVHLAGPGDGAYRPEPDREVPFPARPRSGDVQRVVEAVDPAAPLRATLQRLGIPTADVRAVDRLRVLVASTAFPYLRPA